MVLQPALLAMVVACALGCTPAPSTSARPASSPSIGAAPLSTAATSRAIRGADHVVFASRDADLNRGIATNIDAWIFRPPGDGPFAAVIALHGCAGLYAKSGDLTSRHRDWAERLVSQGYAVLMPDSFGARGFTEICSQDQRTVRPSYERTRDVYGALEYVQHLPFVRANRVAVLGWSNGAMTTLASVSHTARARPPDLAHDFRVAVAFYPGCRETLARDDWMPPVAPLHILIGEKDDWTQAAPCQELVERARHGNAAVDIVVYPGAYHDFDDASIPVHVRANVSTTASHTATIGYNPEARRDAIDRVTRILHDALALEP